jgi:hypothetical protein
MGNYFNIPKSSHSNQETSSGRWSTARHDCDTGRLQLLRVSSNDSEDENKPEQQQLPVVRRQPQSSTENRANESQFSEKRRSAAEAQGSSSQVSIKTQNELQSFESLIDKVQPLGKEQYPASTDSEQALQDNK